MKVSKLLFCFFMSISLSTPIAYGAELGALLALRQNVKKEIKHARRVGETGTAQRLKGVERRLAGEIKQLMSQRGIESNSKFDEILNTTGEEEQSSAP